MDNRMGHDNQELAICMVALGVFLWIIAVFLMVEGSILGKRTTGIATLLGLMGMFIILITCMYALMTTKAEKS